MLEAGKGLGERSGDIERRTELDFSFFLQWAWVKQYAFVSILYTLKSLQRTY